MLRLEESDEWCSLGCTKRPPLHFIDVLVRLSWLPSECVLYTVVGLQADRCTWLLSTERDLSSSFIVLLSHFALFFLTSLSATAVKDLIVILFLHSMDMVSLL